MTSVIQKCLMFTFVLSSLKLIAPSISWSSSGFESNKPCTMSRKTVNIPSMNSGCRIVVIYTHFYGYCIHYVWKKQIVRLQMHTNQSNNLISSYTFYYGAEQQFGPNSEKIRLKMFFHVLQMDTNTGYCFEWFIFSSISF